MVTDKTVKELPNVVSFKKMSDAIDHLNVNSKVSVENQLVNYLDKNISGDFKLKFQKMKRSTSVSLTSKEVGGVVDLDQQLNEVGFTDVQKGYVYKITALYPLTDNNGNSNVNDDTAVKNIKSGLLIVRNEVMSDVRLNESQKQQMYTYIDMQYITLDSVINYVEKIVSSPTSKWKISLKKIINIVVSVIVTTVISAVIGIVAAVGAPEGAFLGAIAGFGSSLISAAQNRCIKFCGTGYCNTAWDDCYTGRLETAFTIKYNQ
jgi:hypothetical protein